MADTVTVQTLVDGISNCVMVFTNISDGTGESAVTKVDVSALSGSPGRVRIDRIVADTAGMGLDILWDASSDQLAWHVPANESVNRDFCYEGGLQNPRTAGWTGDIKFTTLDAASGDRYSVVLHMTKKRG